MNKINVITFCLTIIVLLRLGHRSEEMRRPLDRLALVRHHNLVHPVLVGTEVALARAPSAPDPASLRVPVEVEVEVDRARGADDLGGDVLGLHQVRVEDVDFEVELQRGYEHCVTNVATCSVRMYKQYVIGLLNRLSLGMQYLAKYAMKI